MPYLRDDEFASRWADPEVTHDTCEERIAPDCSVIATETRSDGIGYTTYLCSPCARAWDRIIKPHPVKASA